MKKNNHLWIISIFFLLAVFLFYFSNQLSICGRDLLIIYEAKTGKEAPVHSAGDCRIRAMEEAVKMQDAKVLVFLDKNNSLHAVAIDHNNIVHDESKSAKEAEMKGQKINKISYDQYSQYIKEEIFSVKINNLKKISNTVIKKPQNNDANEAEHYVNVFLECLNGDYIKIFNNAIRSAK
ncbi:MAG: hypothetical protein ACYDD5_10350 [Sulfuricurvum sp.]